MKLKKRIDWVATLSQLKVGDSIIVDLTDATESMVRRAASHHSKINNIRLSVSAKYGDKVATISREA